MQNRINIFSESVKKLCDRLNEKDITLKSEILGGLAVSGSLAVPLYGLPYQVSVQGVRDLSGNEANPAVSVLLLTYVLNCPVELPPAGEWITFRDFRGAGVLSGHFTQNTNKIIETSFSGKIERLRMSALKLGGVPSEEFANFDLSMQFYALPRVPVLLRFNDAEGPYSAQCSILFKRSAEVFLDIESIGIAGTLLTGSLIKE